MFDRNYESLEFMDFLEESGVKYLIRLHKGHYEVEKAAMKSNDEEAELAYTKHRLNRLKRKTPLRAAELERQQSVQVRIIKTVFDNGEEAAFMTNMREGNTSDIKRLYRKRWSIEKKYHTLKNKLKFESVTGKASIYVKQDFWAQALVFNMVQDLINSAECRAVKMAKKKQYKYAVRINENIAIGLFKEKFIRLVREEDDRRKSDMFRRLTSDMERYIVPVRKLKSSPRKWKYFNKYKCNLKPSF
jgi:IS4 transposase